MINIIEHYQKRDTNCQQILEYYDRKPAIEKIKSLDPNGEFSIY